VSLKKDSEFVFAHPCDESDFAGRRHEMSSDLLQADVPRIVTMRIVHVSKVVDIHQDQRGRLAEDFGKTGAVLQLLPEFHPAAKSS
jgi:copper oxidase (laccase) domain-containing protein